MSARPFFIGAAACLVANVILIQFSSTALEALGGLALIVAVILFGCGLWYRHQARRSLG